MDFDQTWYILSPYKSLEPYWFFKVQILLRTKYVPSLVKIHWRMLILECSQGCYTVKDLPSDLDLWPWKSIGFQNLLRTKYVSSLIKIHWRMLILVFTRMLCGKHLPRWPWPPLANEVAKGYHSNATVRPSFHNILVNTLESTSFNGFWPNLVHA
jgi:hypothetical protein